MRAVLINFVETPISRFLHILWSRVILVFNLFISCREKIALLEKQFLQQKQQLLRAREAAIWEMEERQLHEKYQVGKSQLKDHFFLQRHQMLTRHDKELEQVNLKKKNYAFTFFFQILFDKKK